MTERQNGRRMFEVRATYLEGAVERSASVRAETPEQAAALAVWRGYLPVRFDSHEAWLRPVFWHPGEHSNRCWPKPVSTYAVSADHARVHFAFGDCTEPALAVEARALP